MKKLLFDLISIQGCINGGAEYTYRIFRELIRLETNLEIFAIYDSKKELPYNDISYFRSRVGNLIDVNSVVSISQIISKFEIDCFFIGIGQRYFPYNLTDLDCQIIMVIHDVGDVETYSNKIYRIFKHHPKSKLTEIIYALKDIYLLLMRKKENPISGYAEIMKVIKKENVELLTVSEYSKSSLKYYFNVLGDKKIEVLYPPLKEVYKEDIVLNPVLKNIIQTKKKYYLLVNAHREDKNAAFVMRVFKKFQESNKEFFLITTGGIVVNEKFHISLPMLTLSDLEYAYENAFAFIYPSLQEGFGYPPLEAMKYGTPVIVSNVCSMPEVLSKESLLFSPFYENDLYIQINKLLLNYDFYKEEALKNYQKVRDRQTNDLNILIRKIISD
ncbi:MAG: glycosyltransferase [Bacteroidales bacterium]